MTATLTDRYITATVRRLPQQLQAEVREELQTSIADAIDARAEQGEPLDQAERAVLTDLGDPAALAAGYADRPLHLIGPKYYLFWWRVLTLLLATVPACAFVGVAIGKAVAGEGIGPMIGEGIATALSAIVHVSFWTTLVFVILERTGSESTSKWDLDQLPQESGRGAGRGDLIGSLVLLAIFAVLLLLDHFRGIAVVGGEMVTIIDPTLWPVWIGVVFALMAAEAAIAIAVYAHGSWTVRLAVVNTVVAVVTMSLFLTLLGRGMLFAPEFVDAVFARNGVGGDARTVLAVLLGLGIAGIAVWDSIDGWRKARRAQLAV
ncbi:permease prefix domain 1-containing protein [Microbacterium sp. 22195]|uniref:permease prefix domain 1-containing protein n=1 Tax=Microbacterium sp. 22195 TaxID=3453891 RepID=UPI003F832345